MRDGSCDVAGRAGAWWDAVPRKYRRGTVRRHRGEERRASRPRAGVPGGEASRVLEMTAKERGRLRRRRPWSKTRADPNARLCLGIARTSPKEMGSEEQLQVFSIAPGSAGPGSTSSSATVAAMKSFHVGMRTWCPFQGVCEVPQRQEKNLNKFRSRAHFYSSLIAMQISGCTRDGLKP